MTPPDIGTFAIRRRAALIGLALLPGIAVQPAAAAPTDIVVGQVASLSGTDGADLGQGLRDGVQACFSAVNAAGGVRGRALRLVSLDDRYMPDETVRLTRTLIDEHRPVALIGYRGTACTLAIVQANVLPPAGITLVGTLTGARELQGAPGVLHLRTTYERELSELTLQIRRMSLDRVAVLYVDDAFGRTGLAAIEKAAAASGSALAAAVPYDKAPGQVEASLDAAARQLAQAPAVALVLVAVGEPVYRFISAFRPMAPHVRLFCMSVVDPAAVVRRCGAATAAGIAFSQVYPYPYSDRSTLVREYRRALARLPGAPGPGYFSLEGYVYASVLVEALRRSPDPPSPRTVTAAVDALPGIDLGGLRIQPDPLTRNGVRYTDLTVLRQDGRLLH